ncbi:DUF547 domain-containing protein [Marinobacter metalliresistant]|uniref:DUF547 domain-containing protein n=1 Tax=Marinobacter metalliresistant TaxID=2961995 RepID=A0ABZ2VY25_9GAMM
MRGYRLASGFVALVLMPGLVWADINSGLYKPYQRLLSSYLIERTLPGDGLVSAFDYQAALADTDLVSTLERQRKALSEFNTGALEARQESVAFWINAYNFFMLEQILTERPDGYLVSSVWDYGGRVNPFVDSVFERESFVIGGERFSLNEIEKGVLLGEGYQSRGWKDSRIHFAVNCASVGCPPLRDQIYTAANLEGLLEENTRRAFNTQHHLRVTGDTLYGTELFKWYKEDFVEAEGSVRAFIRRWASDSVAEHVARTAELDYIDYDWSLNRPANVGLTGFE